MPNHKSFPSRLVANFSEEVTIAEFVGSIIEKKKVIFSILGFFVLLGLGFSLFQKPQFEYQGLLQLAPATPVRRSFKKPKSTKKIVNGVKNQVKTDKQDPAPLPLAISGDSVLAAINLVFFRQHYRTNNNEATLVSSYFSREDRNLLHLTVQGTSLDSARAHLLQIANRIKELHAARLAELSTYAQERVHELEARLQEHELEPKELKKLSKAEVLEYHELKYNLISERYDVESSIRLLQKETFEYLVLNPSQENPVSPKILQNILISLGLGFVIVFFYIFFSIIWGRPQIKIEPVA